MSFRKCRTLLQFKCARKLAMVALMILLFILSVYLYYLDHYGPGDLFRHTGGTIPCVLPKLDPFDKKLMEYVWKLDPLVCSEPPIVFVDTNNTLQYNVTAMNLANERPSSVKCEIFLIKRILDDDIEYLDPFPWQPGQPVSDDYFRIKCTGASGTLFDNTLTRINRKEKLFKKLSYALAEDKYNLILFGIDSLSRSAAIRQLPNTVKYLQMLGGVDMKGYMKVGDRTFANIAPLLTGKFPNSDDMPEINSGHLGDLPWIWKNFSEQRTVTMFAEDMPDIGTKGFLNYPTDHYMRPFWLANKKLMPLYFARTGASRILEHSKHSVSKMSIMCLADKPNHVVLIDYLKQFMLTYKKHRKFSFSFLTELSHELQNILQLGDNDITYFLKWLSQEGFLKTSIFIMFGDHGIKFGNSQHLFVARMEDRMPFLSIVLPETLKQKYPNIDKNLKLNQERLTSTFDLHATVRDILDGNFKHPGSFKVKDKLRGISLFSELPEVRSCADASIGEQYCACYKSTKLNFTNNPLADQIANSVVDHINSLVRGQDKCAQLKLYQIIDLMKIDQGLKYSGTRRTFFMRLYKNAEIREDTRHAVVLETVPGHAKFYATCDVIKNSVKVFENVDRINKYGNQSYCVDLQELRPFCYCNP